MVTHSVERFRELMGQIGEIEDFGMVVGHDEQSLWQVIIAESDSPIVLELDDDRQVVTLTSEIGSPDSERVNSINALALEYSNLYSATGGARIARNKDDGIYSLIADFGVESLSRATLGDILRRFVRMTEGWADIISGSSSPKADPANSSEPDGFFVRA